MFTHKSIHIPVNNDKVNTWFLLRTLAQKKAENGAAAEGGINGINKFLFFKRWNNSIFVSEMTQ